MATRQLVCLPCPVRGRLRRPGNPWISDEQAEQTMLSWLTPRKEIRQAAHRLYEAIVAQSRLPAFYADLGVPDTVTGRFEMIVVHMFLVLERLQSSADADGERTVQVGQALNEAFISDMDSAMREMGVADVRVGKRMHQAAGAFFGRLLAYRQALAAATTSGTNATDGALSDALAAALARNVLAEATGAESTDQDSLTLEAVATAAVPPALSVHKQAAAGILAAYVRDGAIRLAAQPTSDLLAATIAWPQLPAMAAQQMAPTPRQET